MPQRDDGCEDIKIARRFYLRPEISWGDLSILIGFLLALATYAMRTEGRFAALETKQQSLDERITTRQTAVDQRFSLQQDWLQREMGDIKRTLERIADRLDTKADKP